MVNKKGGQPKNTNALKFKSYKQLEDAINSYFEDRDEKKLPYQVFSLIVHLNIDDDTWYKYKNGTYDVPSCSYSGLIKKAYRRIQSYATDFLFKNGSKATGAIFYLKCNHGWTETQQVDLNHKGTISISFDDQD